jgi:hypothetical protein
MRWFGIPWLVRRWAFRRGVRSGNDLVHFAALVVIGRSAFLRRTARIKGVRGREPAWLALAGVFFAKDILTKLTVKETEMLSTEILRAGQHVTITSIAPTTRRRRRAASS